MFSDRIRKRQRLWWRNPGTSQTLVQHLQRLEMLHVHIGRDAPDSRWQKGKYWQRRLLNKLNAKEFAIRHGCRVPQVYWHGRLLSKSVLSSLPGQFVLKPVLGKAGKGAYVMDGSTDLLSGRAITRGDLFREIAAGRGRLSHIPLLAEELIPGQGAAHTLPVEYKFHVFRDTIGAIQVVHRLAKNAGATSHRFYSPQWEPFADPMQTNNAFAEPTQPPDCLAQMIDNALELGKSFDTYVRVDQYAAGDGCVFGEFASIPNNARTFTAYADEFFEQLWQENIPDRI